MTRTTRTTRPPDRAARLLCILENENEDHFDEVVRVAVGVETRDLLGGLRVDLIAQLYGD